MDTVGFSVLEKWIADRRSMWEQRLDRLGELLDQLDEGEVNASEFYFCALADCSIYLIAAGGM